MAPFDVDDDGAYQALFGEASPRMRASRHHRGCGGVSGPGITGGSEVGSGGGGGGGGQLVQLAGMSGKTSQQLSAARGGYMGIGVQQKVSIDPNDRGRFEGSAGVAEAAFGWAPIGPRGSAGTTWAEPAPAQRLSATAPVIGAGRQGRRTFPVEMVDDPFVPRGEETLARLRAAPHAMSQDHASRAGQIIAQQPGDGAMAPLLHAAQRRYEGHLGLPSAKIAHDRYGLKADRERPRAASHDDGGGDDDEEGGGGAERGGATREGRVFEYDDDAELALDAAMPARLPAGQPGSAALYEAASRKRTHLMPQAARSGVALDDPKLAATRSLAANHHPLRRQNEINSCGGIGAGAGWEARAAAHYGEAAGCSSQAQAQADQALTQLLNDPTRAAGRPNPDQQGQVDLVVFGRDVEGEGGGDRRLGHDMAALFGWGGAGLGTQHQHDTETHSVWANNNNSGDGGGGSGGGRDAQTQQRGRRRLSSANDSSVDEVLFGHDLDASSEATPLHEHAAFAGAKGLTQVRLATVEQLNDPTARMHVPIEEHSRTNPLVLREGRVNEIVFQQVRAGKSEP